MFTTATIAPRSFRVARCRRGPATKNHRTERECWRVPIWNASKAWKPHTQSLCSFPRRMHLGAQRPCGLWRSQARKSFRNGIVHPSGQDHTVKSIGPKTCWPVTQRTSDILVAMAYPVARLVRRLRCEPARLLGWATATRSSTTASQSQGWLRRGRSTTIDKRGWNQIGEVLLPYSHCIPTEAKTLVRTDLSSGNRSGLKSIHERICYKQRLVWPRLATGLLGACSITAFVGYPRCKRRLADRRWHRALWDRPSR